MKEKRERSSWLYGVIFVFLFVAQGAISETFTPFNLVTPYWWLIVALVLVTFYLFCKRIKNSAALLFVVISSFFAVLTLLSDYTPGMVLAKILFVFTGYVGFAFIDNKRPFNLWPFIFLIVIMYVYYEMVYFGVVDEYNHKEMEYAGVLDHSSTNAIAICLLTVYGYYYILNHIFKSGHEMPLMILSFINFYLIIIQESRAGLLVSLMYCIWATYDFILKRRKTEFKIGKIIVYAFVVLAVFAVLYKANRSSIEDYLFQVGIKEIMETGGTEEGRLVLIQSFFNDMDFKSFLLGHQYGKLFAGFDNRTYNALFDFWNLYGFVPFFLFCYLALERVVSRRKYAISLMPFVPIFIHSLFESFLVKSLWMSIVFVFLFLKENKKEESIKLTR